MATPLAASLRGDREAFGGLIQQYQNTVYAVVYNITGNLQQSEDLTQETFVAAWLQLKELRDEAKFPAWLCGIARNLAQNWVRTNARRKTPVARSELVEQLAAEPERGLTGIPPGETSETQDRHEQAALVWEILQELPEQYREPLVLFYQQSQSTAEIAAALDLTEATVRQRLSRGRAQIREEVAGRVEQALEGLQPDKLLYVTILAALPIATMNTAQAVAATFATVTGGTVAGGMASGSTGGGTLGTATGATTLWGVILHVLLAAFYILFFPFLITFSMVVNYAAFRDLPTIRSRRAHLKYHLMVFGMIPIVTFSVFFSAIMLNSLNANQNAFTAWVFGIFFMIFFAGVIMTGLYIRIRINRVLEEDLGKRPAPDVPLEESSLSLRSVKRAVRFMTIVASISIIWFAGFFGGLLVVSSFPVSPLAAIAAGLVTPVVIVILIWLVVRFLQLLLVMATEEGLLRFPPKETYTVLKFRPHDRWWRKPEPEKPLELRDYVTASIPGAIFTMLLLAGCQGTTASTEAFLLAILPILVAGPLTFFAFRDMKNARLKASSVSGFFAMLWMLFVIGWLLYEPLTDKWGKPFVLQQIVMFCLIMIVVLIQHRKKLWGV